MGALARAIKVTWDIIQISYFQSQRTSQFGIYSYWHQWAVGNGGADVSCCEWVWVVMLGSIGFSQRAFACSKSTMKHQNNEWNLFKINNKSNYVNDVIVNFEEVSHNFDLFSFTCLNFFKKCVYAYIP